MVTNDCVQVKTHLDWWAGRKISGSLCSDFLSFQGLNNSTTLNSS